MVEDNQARERYVSSIKLLAVSFAFPPLAYPRSIQVSRLVKYLGASTVMVCADEQEARKDYTLAPNAESHLEACLRVPFSIPTRTKYVNALAHRFYRPLWYSRNLIPDQYNSWKQPALHAIDSYATANSYTPDVICTFSQPLIDHLIGLELKKKYRCPWVAHFSDPWTDNPFIKGDDTTIKQNLELEREVIEKADRLVFTCQETVDLVMAKYPSTWSSKVRVFPQSFDPEHYPTTKADDSKLRVRHVGNFYGSRTAAPLIKAIVAINAAEPSALKDIAFELIGVTVSSTVQIPPGLPAGLITAGPPIDYRQSLELMASSDGLMIIDAPAQTSVFLPSKLIDYLGAQRPILGLTPRGAAATVIRRVGGWVADPADEAAVVKSVKEFIEFLRQNRTPNGNQLPWGRPDVRQEYEAVRLTKLFENLLLELVR